MAVRKTGTMGAL